MSAPTVRARARSREDRAGDPLDGLVNLFDLGIVLAVAFLLAALSSLKLSPDVLANHAAAARSRDAVVARPGDRVQSVRLQPGERVVGRGTPVGTVYRLDDGRTIVVQSAGAAGASTAPRAP